MAAADDGRDTSTGRLAPGHKVRPLRRGKPTDADLIRKKLAPHREAVLDKLVELAVAGDPKSQSLFLAYLAPPARPEPERVLLPGLLEAKTLEDKASMVLGAIGAGQCSVDMGVQLLTALGLFARAGKADELERRLDALERGLNPTPLAPRGDGTYEAKT